MRNFRCVDLGADPATPIASWVAASLPSDIIPPIHQRQSCPAFRARIVNAGMKLRHTAVGSPRSRANSPQEASYAAASTSDSPRRTVPPAMGQLRSGIAGLVPVSAFSPGRTDVDGADGAGRDV